MKFLKDKRKVVKSYSFLSMAANFAVALSISGLSVLGVISSELAFPLLLCLAITFGVVGLLGRFVDQGLDDIAKGSEEDAK